MARFLIATLDAALYDALSAEITGEGHDAVWASDGKDACDAAVQERVDAVFVTEELPVFGGFEVVEILRGDPDVPAELPIYLLADNPPEPHRFERAGFTGRFPVRHGYHELRELLAACIQAGAPRW
jgi:DNA-binding response OmpR family regulator